MKIDLSMLDRAPGKKDHLYEQVMELIRGAILAGVYAPGERIEPERAFISAGHGLSYATVSRAFRELAREGWLTRKVGAGTFVSDLVPDKRAKLRKIGVFYGYPTTEFFQRLYAGIESECRIHGIETEVGATGLSDEAEAGLLAAWGRGEVDGIVGVPIGSLRMMRLLVELMRKKFPAVMAASGFEQLSCDAVLFDNDEGAWEATRHLLDLGHRHILYAGAEPRFPYSMLHSLTVRGVQRALRESGLGPDTLRQVLLPIGFREDDARYAARLRAPFKGPPATRPTAVVCDGDGFGRYVYHVLHKAGLRVPRDVSVIGAGDLPFARQLDPPLTTIRWPLERMGREAVRLLVSRAAFPDRGAVRVLLDTGVVIRHSTGPAPC